MYGPIFVRKRPSFCFLFIKKSIGNTPSGFLIHQGTHEKCPPSFIVLFRSAPHKNNMFLMRTVSYERGTRAGLEACILKRTHALETYDTLPNISEQNDTTESNSGPYMGCRGTSPRI